jgi:hypothetical protein
MNVPSRELMPVICAALERGQRVRLTVNGSSMLPFIRDGDVVELEPPRASLALGDIVLVHSSAEHCVMHRVVRIEGDALFLRGDAQQRCQGPFAQSDVLGKVIVSYRNGRARALDRGVWRLAGLIWTRCKPLGLRLFLLAGRIRRSGGRVKHGLTKWGARLRLH